MLKELIVGKDKPSQQKEFIWNMLGSTIYALGSMILSYMTIRIAGEKDGGVFAIAITLAQMFVYFAYYEMRNFQLTDAKKQFEFEDYHAVKIINCILMIAISLGYCLVKGYAGEKLLIVMLVCIYRMLDGFSDLFEAQFHYKERLDLAGKSMTFRTIISIVVYFIVLMVSGNLVAAIVAAIISGIIGIWLFNYYVFDTVGKVNIRFDFSKMLGIWKQCFPMFLGMFLWTYLLSASRIAVDDVMTSEYQSYYQVLFLPVSVINLLAGFLVRPALANLTKLNAERKHLDFWKTIGKMIVLLAGFTVVCMIGAYLIGIPVLEILAGCDLSDYRMLFVFLIFAGGVNAVASLLYYVLSIFRSGLSILLGFGISSVLAMLISNPMVKNSQLWGAAESYLICIGCLAVIFILCIAILERSNKITVKN